MSVHKVRRIVNDFDESVAEVAMFYDESEDTDVDQEEATTFVEAEEEQLEVALTLYDEYVTLVSSVLLNAPILSELRFNECEQVILDPCRQVDRNDLINWNERIRFFIVGLNDLVTAALTEPLAGM